METVQNRIKGTMTTVLGAYIGDLEFYGEVTIGENRGGFIEAFDTYSGDTHHVTQYGNVDFFQTWNALIRGGTEANQDREYQRITENEREFNEREAAYEAEQERKQLAYYESRGW